MSGGVERVREAIARARGHYAPNGPVPLCGEPDGTERRVDSWPYLVDTPEVLEADDTVPVEKLAAWLHGEFGGPEPWAGCAERTRENYRRTVRAMRSQLPELFR